MMYWGTMRTFTGKCSVLGLGLWHCLVAAYLRQNKPQKNNFLWPNWPGRGPGTDLTMGHYWIIAPDIWTILLGFVPREERPGCYILRVQLKKFDSIPNMWQKVVYEVEYLFNSFHFLSGNDCNLGNPSPGMWPLLRGRENLRGSFETSCSWMKGCLRRVVRFELIFSNYF